MKNEKGLRGPGLSALAYIRENPGVSIAQVDRARRTARGGHAWMYRTVHRLIDRGLVRASPEGAGNAYFLVAVEEE